MIENILIIFIAYLLGSIPFGLLLTRMAGLGDVRNIGSGNIGATNVMRTGKKWLGILTLLLDMAKGYAGVLIAACAMACYGFDVPSMLLLTAGMAAVLGHVFSIFLKFKGGKGVATAIGVLLALNPMMALTYAIFWLLILGSSRFVSVASIVSFWALLVVYVPNANANVCLFLSLLALLITWTHRGNIARLKEGAEPKIGKKKNE
ncbi:MAG: glycerol-3-phosphate 1-O-acyltransferase PlsY [Alphaproteobacteria bacterium]